ncbi:uncharacterized protein LOC129299135 [Prosopis cineraria]|uniref:uncharacterized protein LOC129299135 n=1 Tax=Prosopis cineraria TaxID=364024 RepID=UPI002410015B|nr:uncharacterized protein LOC129299135 [Prosopis cineraria]
MEFQYLLLVRQWWDLRQKAIALLMCVVHYYFIRMSRKRKISHSTRGSKRRMKHSKKDTEFSKIVIEGISEIANALREGNAIRRESYSYKLPQISGEEAWNLIQECGCDIDKLPEIYCFLMNDQNKLTTVVQCPAEARKAVIMEMAFGSPNTSS